LNDKIGEIKKWRIIMVTKTQSWSTSQLFAVLLAGLLLLSACSTATPLTILPKPSVTTVSVETAATIPDGSPRLFLVTSSIAKSFQTEIVAAVPSDVNAPYWEVLPEYTQVTLQGYPISNHLMKPQIFIYPVNDLVKINEGADKNVISLNTLLQSHQEITDMPFLPLFNAAQVMHAQMQYLNFKNGQGLRFLTAFSQGIVPINNYELIYTCQGLTSDGKYYVAAVLPVNHPRLPADGKVTGNETPEFTSDYLTYVANVVKALDSQAANTLTPDLTQLDAMMSSLEIK
jgi:hypothetical protein